MVVKKYPQTCKIDLHVAPCVGFCVSGGYHFMQLITFNLIPPPPPTKKRMTETNFVSTILITLVKVIQNLTNSKFTFLYFYFLEKCNRIVYLTITCSHFLAT